MNLINISRLLRFVRLNDIGYMRSIEAIMIGDRSPRFAEKKEMKASHLEAEQDTDR